MKLCVQDVAISGHTLTTLLGYLPRVVFRLSQAFQQELAYSACHSIPLMSSDIGLVSSDATARQHLLYHASNTGLTTTRVTNVDSEPAGRSLLCKSHLWCSAYRLLLDILEARLFEIACCFVGAYVC